MHWSDQTDALKRERERGGEGDSRIFDTESGVCAYFMTENWSQVGESRIDELGNEGENSRVVKLVMVIHHLAMHLPKEQAHHHHNHHNGYPQMLWVPPTTHHVVEWWWNKNEQKGGLGLSFCFGEWRRQCLEDMATNEGEAVALAVNCGTRQGEPASSWQHVRTRLRVVDSITSTSTTTT